MNRQWSETLQKVRDTLQENTELRLVNQTLYAKLQAVDAIARRGIRDGKKSHRNTLHKIVEMCNLDDA